MAEELPSNAQIIGNSLHVRFSMTEQSSDSPRNFVGEPTPGQTKKREAAAAAAAAKHLAPDSPLPNMMKPG